MVRYNWFKEEKNTKYIKNFWIENKLNYSVRLNLSIVFFHTLIFHIFLYIHSSFRVRFEKSFSPNKCSYTNLTLIWSWCQHARSYEYLVYSKASNVNSVVKTVQRSFWCLKLSMWIIKSKSNSLWTWIFFKNCFTKNIF